LKRIGLSVTARGIFSTIATVIWSVMVGVLYDDC
jgi:hypothetical protein